MTTRTPCPSVLSAWRPDEAAECLDVSRGLRAALWNAVGALVSAGTAVPLGGDGTNGTVETPLEPDAYADGRMGEVWALLTEEQQEELAAVAAGLTE